MSYFKKCTYEPLHQMYTLVSDNFNASFSIEESHGRNHVWFNMMRNGEAGEGLNIRGSKLGMEELKWIGKQVGYNPTLSDLDEINAVIKSMINGISPKQLFDQSAKKTDDSSLSPR